MNISKLATKANSDEGKWFRVELYGEKQDLWLNILGSDSDKVQNFQRKQIKKINANTGKDQKLSNDAIDEMLDSDIDGVLVRLNGIAGGSDTVDVKDPVILNDVTLGNDEESYRLLLTEIPALKKFITDKSNDRLNFLS